MLLANSPERDLHKVKIMINLHCLCRIQGARAPRRCSPRCPSLPPQVSSTIHGLIFHQLNSLHAHSSRITKVYETESYDYPIQVQESLSEVSQSIGYNISSFAASNLKGTNLPVPLSPTAPPEHHHKTLPHALARAARSAAGTVASAAGTAAPAESGDKLGKALGLYAEAFERIASARLDQDDAIVNNFYAPWQQTLNTSISLAMKARQAVQVSRLELDAAKQT